MKKLFAIAFVFYATTSFAQTLTPDMLVGEYEGTMKIMYVNDVTKEFKKQKIKITKFEDSDSLKLTVYERDFSFDTHIKVVDSGIKLYSYSFIDFGNNITKTETFKNYVGDKFESLEFGKYDSEKKTLKLSFVSTVSANTRTSNKYYYLEMKKK